MSTETTKVCRMCGIELPPMSTHLSTQHCVRDLSGRIKFMRQIMIEQAKQLTDMEQAVLATHRIAYAVLHHLTDGFGRLGLDRADLERLPSGCAVTMAELEDGSFEVVGVVPQKKEVEEKPA